jgi:hypothetical protein
MRRAKPKSQTTRAPGSPFLDHGLLWLGVLGLFGAFFGQLFWEPVVLAFRDTAHYYYPLLRYVKSQWLQGEIPLWNPYDNLGVPLGADPTSLVFYPGILLLFVGSTFGQALNLFIVAHFVLAFYGSWKLARRWRASAAGAALAAVSYTFSGIFLFQYTNLVYLVGASWLPLALATFDQAVRNPRPAHTVIAALTFSCIILGGDFQTAYHVILLWLSYILVLRFGSEPPPGNLRFRSVAQNHLATDIEAHDPSIYRPLASTGAGIGEFRPQPWRVWFTIVTIAAGLGAIVWLPAAEFALLSDRQITAEPRSLYEWVYQTVMPWLEDGAPNPLPSWRALLAQTQPGTHHEAVFDFSLAPTRWAEFLWPNFSGRTFPLNHRWLSALGGEDRIWTPSLYMGMVPFLLALVAFRLKSRIHPTACWLSWVVIFGIVASLGYFGLGYLWQWFLRLTEQNPEEPLAVGPAFGGLYWILTVLLPGYVNFRYPSKWLVVTALGISQLAAFGWTEATRPGRRVLAALCFAITLLNGGLLGVAMTFRAELEDRLQHAAGDPAFGPVVPSGCTHDLIWSFAQAAAVGLTAGMIVALSAKRAASWLVLLTCLELAVANRWMLATVEERELNSPPAVAHAILPEATPPGENLTNAAENTPILRIFREGVEVAPSWRQFSSSRRLTEIVAWHRDSLFSKFHLLVPMGSLSPGVCYRPADWQFTLWVCQKPPQPKATMAGKNDGKPTSAGVNQTASTAASEGALLKSVHVPPSAWAALLQEYTAAAGMAPVTGEQALFVPTGMVLWRRRNPQPLVWLTQEVKVLPELRSHDPRAMWQRTAEVLFAEGSLRDFQKQSVLEMPPEAFSLVAAVTKISSDSSDPISSDSSHGSDSDSRFLGQSTENGSDKEQNSNQRIRKLPAQAVSLSPGRASDQPAAENQPKQEPPPPSTAPSEPESAAPSAGWCLVLFYRSTRMQIQVYAPAGGVVVVAQQYYPGWRAWVEPVEGPLQERLPCSIWRANRVMQGIVVPPGHWLLTLAYRPLSFRVGAVLSFFSLLGIIAWLALFSATRGETSPLSGDFTPGALLNPRAQELLPTLLSPQADTPDDRG